LAEFLSALVHGLTPTKIIRNPVLIDHSLS
jgi:hypothetical protein